jgi:hypothetical protein
MKVTEYTSDKYPGKIFSQEYDLDDLIEGIDEFDKETLKKICTEFLDMMVKDLIEENNCFVFPIHKFGFITVKDICNVNHPDYAYDVVNGRSLVSYQPVINGDGVRKRINGMYPNYIVRFIGKALEKFEEEIKNNHYY